MEIFKKKKSKQTKQKPKKKKQKQKKIIPKKPIWSKIEKQIFLLQGKGIKILQRMQQN